MTMTIHNWSCIFLQLPTSQRWASSRFSTLSLYALSGKKNFGYWAQKKHGWNTKKPEIWCPAFALSQFMLDKTCGSLFLRKSSCREQVNVGELDVWKCCLHQSQSTKKHEFGSWNPELTHRCFRCKMQRNFRCNCQWGTQFWDELPICQRQKDPQKVWFTLCSQVTLHERGLEPHLPDQQDAKLFSESL